MVRYCYLIHNNFKLGFLLAIAVLLLSPSLLSIMIGSVVHSYEYEGQGQKRTVAQKKYLLGILQAT